MLDILRVGPKAQLTTSRRWFSNTTTIGEFLIHKSPFCFTLEDTVRHGSDGILQANEKIQDQTAIPTGIYEIELDVSGGFGFCPWVLSVPLFTDIRIHWGNRSVDTKGCVIVGRQKYAESIGESKLAFKDLMMELVPMRRLERIYMEVAGGPSVEQMRQWAA